MTDVAAGNLAAGVPAPDVAARDALGRWILTLADGKRILGIRYSDWLLGAPSIEAGIAASAMAQDEWGHARLLYAMLKDVDRDPVAVEHERPASDYRSPDPLDAELTDWAAFATAVVVVDGALAEALRGFSEGSFEAARSRIPKMLQEEEFHRDLGSAWFRRLAGGSPEAVERLRAACDLMLGRTLAWLDPADEEAAALAAAGLVAPGAKLAERFLERAAPVLAAAGVDAAAVAPVRDGWDAERRRGPGHPDESAVERARGDRNRALFVE